MPARARSLFAAVVSAVAVLASTTAQSADGRWTPLTPPVPGSAKVYDPVEDRWLLYGTPFVPGPSDLWVVDPEDRVPPLRLHPGGEPSARGTGWIDGQRHCLYALAAQSPAPGIAAPVMNVFRLALGPVGDWERVPVPSGSEPERIPIDHAYDEATSRLYVLTESPEFALEIWAIDLDADSPRWQRIEAEGEQPEPRSSGVLAFDSAGPRLLLVGGILDVHLPGGVVYAPPTNDVWELALSGTPAWWRRPQDPAGPSPSGGMAAIPDPVSGRTLLYRERCDSCGDSVWILPRRAGESWRGFRVERTRQAAYLGQFAWSPRRQRIMGLDLRTGAWALAPSLDQSWQRISTAVLLPEQWAGGPVVDPETGDFWNLWGAIRDDGGDLVPDRTGRFVLRMSPQPHWERLERPDPGSLSAAVAVQFDPPRRRILVMGTGSEPPTAATLLDQVWVFDVNGDAQWSRLDVAGPAPSYRVGPSLVFDPLRDRFLLLAGAPIDGVPRMEVWALELHPQPHWARIEPEGRAPRGRVTAVAAFDLVRDRVLVQGGRPGPYSESAYRDLWALNLGQPAVWDSISDGLMPTGVRNGAGLGFCDYARDRLVVLPSGQTPTGRNHMGTVAFPLQGEPAIWQTIESEGAVPTSGDVAAPVIGGYDPRGDRFYLEAYGRPGEDWALEWNDPGLEVALEIRPGDPHGRLPGNAHGALQVAVLAGADFDPGTLDPATVRLCGASPRGDLSRDVDGDGRADLVLRFDRDDLTLRPGAVALVLTGRTRAGRAVLGWERVDGTAGSGRGARDVGASGFAADADAPAPGATPALPALGFAAPRPNPAADAVTLPFALAREGSVRLEVFDLAGRRVRVMALDDLAPGAHELVWDGRDDAGVVVGRGVYPCRLTTGEGASARRKVVWLGVR